MCDAFLNHLDAERELGVRSLVAAEKDRKLDLARGEYSLGYEKGSAEGRADADLVRAADSAQEVSRLRAQVRALENKCAKLTGRLSAFKLAHGINAHYVGEDADADSDSDFGFGGHDDDADDLDDLELTTKERRARAAAKPSPAQVEQYITRWFGDRGQRWAHHVEDVQRVRQLAREPPTKVCPAMDEDVEMRSPTHHSQQVDERPAPAPDVPTRGRTPSRQESPPRVIPSRRVRSPSHGHSPAPRRRRSFSPAPFASGNSAGYSTGYAAPPRPPYYPHFGYNTGYPPPQGAAQGGRNGPTPAYADHAYGFAPHYDPTQAFVDYYGNHGAGPPPGPTYFGGRPSPRRRSPSPRRRSPPRTRELSPRRTRSPGRQPLKGSEIPPPLYSKIDAPPVPRTRDEICRIIETAQKDTVAGAHAVAKLRYWNNAFHQRTIPMTPEVERELKAYRLPQWHRDAFEPTKTKGDRGRLEKGKDEKGKGRAGSPMMKEPRADADVPTWTQYAETYPSLLPRHVKRDDDGRVVHDTVAGFVLANRFTSIGNAVPYVQRKKQRAALFRFLAEALTTSQHYADELERVGVTPADTLHVVAYAGPFPPTLDDVIRQAAQCGIAADYVEPVLSAWATHYVSSAPGHSGTAPPADTPNNAGGDGPHAPADDSGTHILGGTGTTDVTVVEVPTPTSGTAGPIPGPSNVADASREDVPMEE